MKIKLKGSEALFVVKRNTITLHTGNTTLRYLRLSKNNINLNEPTFKKYFNFYMQITSKLRNNRVTIISF